MGTKEWGTPEQNNVLGVKATLEKAIANGYLQKLKAYGIGRGMTQAEAEARMFEANKLPQYAENIEIVGNLVKELTTLKNNAVSMGDDNVKEETPTSSETGSQIEENGGDIE